LSGQGSLDVYNISGQKIKTIFQGHINIGKQRFSLNLPPQQCSNLVYVFRVGVARKDFLFYLIEIMFSKV
jgi:hypothetical protein